MRDVKISPKIFFHLWEWTTKNRRSDPEIHQSNNVSNNMQVSKYYQQGHVTSIQNGGSIRSSFTVL